MYKSFSDRTYCTYLKTSGSSDKIKHVFDVFSLNNDDELDCGGPNFPSQEGSTMDVIRRINRCVPSKVMAILQAQGHPSPENMLIAFNGKCHTRYTRLSVHDHKLVSTEQSNRLDKNPRKW